jgi:uncharacterized protein (DUF488 family)
MAEQVELLTIGHSNHALEEFLGLLRACGVNAVADVRSVPHSRLHPQFNQKILAAALKEQGILYSFVGDELGGRPKDKSCYENRRVQYSRVAETEGFRNGIARVLGGARKYRIALMCAEREPLECHRGLLIAPELEKSGASVNHILADGSTESYRHAMDRLLALFRLPEEDLFRSRAELIEEACIRQQERIAYDGRPLPQERAEAAAG